MIFDVLKRGPPSTHTVRASPVSRLKEELGDFLGSVLVRVGGPGLASLNLPTFYLHPTCSIKVHRPFREAAASLSSWYWDRYAPSVLSHSVRSAFGRYALPLRCVFSSPFSFSLLGVCFSLPLSLPLDVCLWWLAFFACLLSFTLPLSLACFSLQVSLSLVHSLSYHSSSALSRSSLLVLTLVPRVISRRTLSHSLILRGFAHSSLSYSDILIGFLTLSVTYYLFMII